MGPRTERGAAVVDFVLIMVLLIPIVLGVMQVALVMHVRNTISAAASEGARAAAVVDGDPSFGAQRTRTLIRAAIADKYADHVSAGFGQVGGVPGTVVRVHAEVPALGLFGPGFSLSVEGHAVREDLP
ncbi:MAG: pilus assembly protein [Actinomycetota bacterium]|nr:pilus assembly protein [Actinomycetota bacterium]